MVYTGSTHNPHAYNITDTDPSIRILTQTRTEAPPPQDQETAKAQTITPARRARQQTRLLALKT